MLGFLTRRTAAEQAALEQVALNGAFPAQPRDPMKLGTLISWLEQQDPSKEYNYYDPWGCLLQQYFKAQGFRKPVVSAYTVSYGSFNFWHLRSHCAQLPEHFNFIAVSARPNAFGRKTFGAALQVARQIQANLNGDW